MIIDFVIGSNTPKIEVLRDEAGDAFQVNIDYRLTLLQVHHAAKSQLSDSEYRVYSEVMMPKPACKHLTIEYTATRGYLRAVSE